MIIQPVDELLCDCLGRISSESLAKRLDSLSHYEWEALLQRSDRHDVTPLLYRRIKALTPANPFPATFVNRLRMTYLYSASRNIRIYHELGKVLGALRDADILVIPLKGVHLAESVYGNIALRPMSDVDILVRESDLSGASDRLIELGYGPFWHSRMEAEIEMVMHLPPISKSGTVPVEVHWSINSPRSPFKVDIAGLWQRARPATIAGVEVQILAPEDLLLHLCIHTSYSHRFIQGLKALCDISETLRHYRDQMDWEQVQYRSNQWGANRCVYLTFYLTRELLGVTVPKQVLEALEPDGFDQAVAAEARAQIFANWQAAPSISPDLARLWAARGILQKVICFLQRIFLPPVIMSQMYPASPESWRIFLYYPVRLKYLLVQYGYTAWRLLHHDKEAITLAEQEEKCNKLIDWLAST